MTFLNALLLGGSAAGLIPLAIHLWHRQKRKTVQWGAMQFLVSKKTAQRQRIKLEQLLLLSIRVSIPVLLALCMARPVVESLSSDEKHTPESVVLLIDNSASMSGLKKDASPFLSAKQTAESFFAKLPKGSEVSVLPLSNPDLPLVEFSVDIRGALRLLKELSAQPTSAQIAEGLQASADLFSRAHHARRRIILMTDFQKTNWSKEHLSACEQALARLWKQNPRPSITLYDAGSSKAENIAVESIEFSQLPAGPGQKLRFTATLRNHGGLTAFEKTLQWKFDGETVSTKILSLKPMESSQLSIEKSFAEPGVHTVEASIEHDDFPYDDSFFACVEIFNPFNVNIINGHSSPELMQGETDFLDLALQPKLKSSTKTVEGILHTSIIEPHGINTKTLTTGKVAILADTRNLTKQQVQDLESFVREGGGVLFFPGPHTDVDWTNKILHAEGRGMLPARIEGLKNAFLATTQKRIGISKTVSTHPVAEFFTRDSGSFDEIAVENWYSLKTSDTGGPSDSTSTPSVILNLENGDPLFVERAYGRGTVIQSAIPCSASWSNLPARPAYVPLMQRLVLHARGSSQSVLNLTAGRPLLTAFETRISNQSILITMPDGKTAQCHPKKEGSNVQIEFFGTHLVGIYQLTAPDGAIRKFAVNVSKEESNPEKLALTEVQIIARQMQAGLAHTSEELLASDSDEYLGREIWRPILWLVLALLVGEIFFLQRFAHKGQAVS